VRKETRQIKGWWKEFLFPSKYNLFCHFRLILLCFMFTDRKSRAKRSHSELQPYLILFKISRMLLPIILLLQNCFIIILLLLYLQHIFPICLSGIVPSQAFALFPSFLLIPLAWNSRPCIGSVTAGFDQVPADLFTNYLFCFI